MLPTSSKRPKHENGCNFAHQLLSGFRTGGMPLILFFFVLFGLTTFFWYVLFAERLAICTALTG